MDMKIGGEDLGQKWISNVFTKMDTNTDGKVDKSEFSNIFSKLLSGKTSEKSASAASGGIDLDKLFSLIDQDGDGQISETDFFQFIEKQKKLPPPPAGLNIMDQLLSGNASDIFSAIDTDGDGVISQDEFVKYIEKQQAAFQANLLALFSGTGATAGVDTTTATAESTTSTAGVV